MFKQLLSIVLLISIALFCTAASSKSYKIEAVDIKAYLQNDGSMNIEETRNFNFQGRFSYAFREFPLDSKAQFSEFKVIENNYEYQLSDSKEPGTYQIYTKDNNTIVKWFYNAKNEIRTFTVSYKAQGAVERYQDVAVMYYQFISSAWKETSRNVDLKIYPPESGNYGSIRHWLHGPLWSESHLESDGSISAWSKSVPRRQYFEVRALYPQELFPGLSQNFDYVEGNIIEEEAKWAEEANNRREEWLQKQINQKKRMEAGKTIMPIVSILACIITILLAQKYGKRPKFNTKIDFLAEAPNDTSPAYVSYLINGRSIYGTAMVGTIFDLSVRKFLTLEEESNSIKPKKKKSKYILKFNRDYFEQHENELRDFEVDLIDFIFTEISDNHDTVEISRLTKKRSKFLKFFEKWKKNVTKQAKAMNWFDRESIKGANLCLGLGALYFIMFFGFTIYFHELGLLFLISMLFTFIMAAIIPHHTPEGRLEAEQWKAFKRYLKKKQYRETSDETLLDNINSLFVYGIIFGLTKKIFSELAIRIPQEAYQQYVFWYHYGHHSHQNFNPESFSKAFSTMVSTTNSAFSSATGSGGGASAGGGGGASSGGGGAG